jgi:ribosome-binding factor A
LRKTLLENRVQRMLAGKRATRVGDVLLKEMADLLMRRVKDPRVKGITLTGVHVSNDLKHAKVYFSLIGDEKEIVAAQQGLESAKGFIKREIGGRMELKYVPDIVFKYDPSLATGERMEKLFQKMKAGRSSERGEQEDPNGEGA